MQNLIKLWTKLERRVLHFRETFGPTGCTSGRNVGRRRGKMRPQISSKIHPKIMKNPPQGSPRAPQISPGTLPRHLEAQKIHKFTKRAPKSRESRPKGPSGRGPKSLKNPSWREGEIFWGPRDLKKIQKDRSWPVFNEFADSCARTFDFLTIFRVFFHHFFSVCSRIFRAKLKMKKVQIPL